MKKSRFAAFFLCGVMAVSVLTGCGGVNKNAAAATFDGEAVSLGVANFAARLQQAGYDDFYVVYFGEDVWSSDMYGNGTTMEASVKDGVMDSLKELYTLEKHVDEYGVSLSEEEKTKIKEAASEFIAANEKDAIDALGADETIVEEYLTLMTVKNKMHTAIVADADTNVSDEEANTSAYSYVQISKTTYKDADGNSAEYTDEEKTELLKTVKAFAAEAKEATLEEAAEKNDYTVSTGTFTAEDESLDENLLAALKKLDEGDVTDLVDTENYYYVARIDKLTDSEATETTRENIISQRKADLYDEVLNGWEDKHEWVVNQKAWEKVKFDNLFTTVVNTEQAGGTENAAEQGTEK